MLWTKSLMALGAVLSVASIATAHMELHSPIARGDRRLKDSDKSKVNSRKDPLRAGRDDDLLPCRYNKPGEITARYTAGRNFTVELMQGNPHNGGHCQIALSYDNAKTSVVVHTIITDCLKGLAPYRIPVPLPSGTPNGNATLVWVFFNAGGNKETYVNCADVEITGGEDGGSLTGPELLMARMTNTPDIPKWRGKDPVTSDSRKLFFDRKEITIPEGKPVTAKGTVQGEPCNGKPGTKPMPDKVDWSQYIGDKFIDGKQRTDIGPFAPEDAPFYIATSDDPYGGTKPPYDVKALAKYPPGTFIPVSKEIAERKKSFGFRPSGGGGSKSEKGSSAKKPAKEEKDAKDADDGAAEEESDSKSKSDGDKPSKSNKKKEEEEE